MSYTNAYTNRIDEIVSLFTKTFTDSEGQTEGELIGKLVRDLILTTPKDDIFVFSALNLDQIIGSIIFTRLTYPRDSRTVFLLSPVAVATNMHKKGVGQSLIKLGLNNLRDSGVDVVMTYGDINFYSKVGFCTVAEEDAKAPMLLQYPEGWLGQSISMSGFEPIAGECNAVSAFDNPDLW